MLSLAVSGAATLISVLIGLPIGTWLALSRMRSRGVVLSVVNTGMALPPVVVGLVVALLLWRSGILGGPRPHVHAGGDGDRRGHHRGPGDGRAHRRRASASWTRGCRSSSRAWARRAGRPSGGSGARRACRSSRPLMAAFGSVISEVGAAMMVGGNIADQTRVLTTSIVLETGRGEFGNAIVLGLVLLTLAFIVNGILTWAQQRGPRA